MNTDFTEGVIASQDGLRLYFRDYGDRLSDAPTVLCLPGLTRNSKDFHKVASRLAATHRVICPDYRGRGRSEYDPNYQNYQPLTYINDLSHLLTSLNAHRIVAIGTSMGGILTMALATVIPSILLGAVINDVGPDVDPEGIQRIIGYIGDDTPRADWQEAVTHLKKVMKDPGLQTDDDWLDLARSSYKARADGKLIIDWDPAIARALSEQNQPAIDLWPLFKSLGTRPVLGIRGGVSDILHAETFEKMATTLPDFTAITVPNVGHTPSLEETGIPEAIDALLDRWTN